LGAAKSAGNEWVTAGFRIIKQGGFPTHAADNADGFHIAPNHVRLSLFRIETGKGLLFLRADGNILENYSN
jgi:hypothetical protein